MEMLVLMVMKMMMVMIYSSKILYRDVPSDDSCDRLSLTPVTSRVGVLLPASGSHGGCYGVDEGRLAHSDGPNKSHSHRPPM